MSRHSLDLECRLRFLAAEEIARSRHHLAVGAFLTGFDEAWPGLQIRDLPEPVQGLTIVVESFPSIKGSQAEILELCVLCLSNTRLRSKYPHKQTFDCDRTSLRCFARPE